MIGHRICMLAIAGVGFVSAAARAQEIDSGGPALAALRDAQAACTADGGALWGRSLCGPIALAVVPAR